ncbi:hypothetical protein CU026_1628 [Enterococcus faecium]|nr:hypothetical protein [Enterococcus faecium]MBK4814823.1 hypothetical protein [Enterococcus faecium]MBL5012069.1 hypothetical protein [Enterococcus lactis]
MFFKEIEIYLQFDLMRRDYAEQAVKQVLKKMKKSAPDSFADKGEHSTIKF